MRFIRVVMIVLTVFMSQLEAMEMMDFVQRTDVRYQKSATVKSQNGTLLLSGGKWTNGRDKGFGYDGNGVRSVKDYNFIDTYVGIKFKVNAGGRYSSFKLCPEGFREAMAYTTHNIWAHSKLIREKIYLYQTLYINSEGGWIMRLSKGGYDKKILYEKRGKLSKSEKKRLKNTKLVFTFADNRTGKSTKLEIFEVELEKEKRVKN